MSCFRSVEKEAWLESSGGGGVGVEVGGWTSEMVMEMVDQVIPDGVPTMDQAP